MQVVHTVTVGLQTINEVTGQLSKPVAEQEMNYFKAPFCHLRGGTDNYNRLACQESIWRSAEYKLDALH
jgi:hypothetical protein